MKRWRPALVNSSKSELARAAKASYCESARAAVEPELAAARQSSGESAAANRSRPGRATVGLRRQRPIRARARLPRHGSATSPRNRPSPQRGRSAPRR